MATAFLCTQGALKSQGDPHASYTQFRSLMEPSDVQSQMGPAQATTTVDAISRLPVSPC